jgi:hypothetical protein
MNQTSLIARVIGVALAIGSLTPALAQRGPPDRGDREREQAREDRDDAEAREERRARRGRGPAEQAPVPADLPRRVAAPAAVPAPDNARAAEVRQDRVARERNAQRQAARQQGEPWRGNAPSDAQERGRQQREAAIEAAQQADRRQQEAWAREQEARQQIQRQQVERRPVQNRQAAPAAPVAVQRPAGYDDRNRSEGRDGRRNDDRRGDRERDDRDRQEDRDRYDDRSRYGGRDDRRDGGSRARDRLPERDRQRLIVQQRQSVDHYRRAAAARHVTEQRRINSLQQQRRMQQYRYQQRYWQRHREMQNRWATLRIDFDNDPYFYTPASYRYQRGGRYYEINRYAADVLEQAVRFGYEEGVRAGEADFYDGWRGGYHDNFAYLDANYGYDGYYVGQGEYNHYFREGFRRGYEDGYGRQYRYGQRRNGEFLIMASVLQLILGLEEFR